MDPFAWGGVGWGREEAARRCKCGIPCCSLVVVSAAGMAREGAAQRRGSPCFFPDPDPDPHPHPVLDGGIVSSCGSCAGEGAGQGRSEMIGHGGWSGVGVFVGWEYRSVGK